MKFMLAIGIGRGHGTDEQKSIFNLGLCLSKEEVRWNEERARLEKKTAKLKAAVAWYKPNQWSRLREISEDRDQLEKTYGGWQIYAEKALNDLAARGGFPEKVTVDTEELLAWCHARGLKVNGKSCSQYASWLLKEKYKPDMA
ncbi:MAG: hypothetical protein SCH71_01865 [Desulfobulbaceae bacterium]|nr:hypothetical protein [Desulfobulbaceae bacterium]